MATYNKFNQFIEDLAHKVHNLGSDTLTVALCNAANAPVATDADLTDLTQIAYTNCSSRVITTTTSEGSDGSYELVLQDLTLTASGGAVATFRYIVIYNDTATNDDLIAWFDYGSDVDLADGESLLIDFGAQFLTLS